MIDLKPYFAQFRRGLYELRYPIAMGFTQGIALLLSITAGLVSLQTWNDAGRPDDFNPPAFAYTMIFLSVFCFCITFVLLLLGIRDYQRRKGETNGTLRT